MVLCDLMAVLCKGFWGCVVSLNDILLDIYIIKLVSLLVFTVFLMVFYWDSTGLLFGALRICLCDFSKT